MNEFLLTILNDDYFAIFIAILFMILIALIIALIKTGKNYYEEKNNVLENDLLKNIMDVDNEKTNDITQEIDSLFNSVNKNDTNINNAYIKENTEENYYDKINKLEIEDEDKAVISTDELEQRKLDKYDELGVSNNQAMIDKYEEEQESKAIISYEQLLKNASNITLSYTEENVETGAPKVNKVEIKSIEVSEAQSYIDEEKFLEILKSFRASLG